MNTVGVVQDSHEPILTEAAQGEFDSQRMFCPATVAVTVERDVAAGGQLVKHLTGEPLPDRTRRY
jgi:hypothetical protein